MTDKYQMSAAAARRVVSAMTDQGISAFSYEVTLTYLRKEGFTQPRRVFPDFLRQLDENGFKTIAIELGAAAARTLAWKLDELDAFKLGLEQLGFVTEEALEEKLNDYVYSGR